MHKKKAKKNIRKKGKKTEDNVNNVFPSAKTLLPSRVQRQERKQRNLGQ